MGYERAGEVWSAFVRRVDSGLDSRGSGIVLVPGTKGLSGGSGSPACLAPLLAVGVLLCEQIDTSIRRDDKAMSRTGFSLLDRG